MSEYADIIGLSTVSLNSKIEFLLQRASFHDEMVSEDRDGDRQLHQATAATLRRDAASIAWLLSDIETGKKLIKTSALGFLDLGLFYGFFLLRLSDSGFDDADEKIVKSNLPWVRAALKNTPFEEPKDYRDMPPYARASAQNPHQLFRLVQSDRRADSVTRDVAEEARRILKDYDGLPLGVTGLPLKSYLRVQDSFMNGGTDALRGDQLAYMALRRQELINAAQADKFHWHRIQNPSELIDFDLLSLGLYLQGHAIQEAAADIRNQRGSIASLPFELAAELAGPEQSLKHEW
jgi:hypothetical protein